MVGLTVGVAVKLALGFMGTGDDDVRQSLTGFVGVVLLDGGNLNTITGLLVVVVVVTPVDTPNIEHFVGLVVFVPSNDNFFTNTILGGALAFGEDCTSGGGPV